MSSDNNKRIAKNTAMLYFRMLFTMAVSLYTSRVVLNTLGVEDFGIYNVVGGVVTMFAFLNSAMASGTQRFLSFELGKKDYEQLNRVFSMSINIHATIAIVIFILAETVGLWFLNTQLTIPEGRIIAANWVYQFSILAFLVTIMSVPYNASIISHERMNIFAYVSIIEVTLKLAIVFMLQWFGFDKLKLYAILVFLVSLIIRLIYGIYCKRNFKECSYFLFWDKKLYNTLLSYAGWNLWGNFASVSMNQGINILLNIFFGPTINAARGVAYQVNGAVNSFVSNFQLAIKPQIVKSYAENNKNYMHNLIYQGAKYSYYLLFMLSLPVIIETESVLKWWLKIVPEHAVLFCRLILINALIDCISGPLMTAAQASGKIKLYQSVVGGLLLCILPISYILLKLGYPAETTIYVNICMSVIALAFRLLIISPLVSLKISMFLKRVIIKIILVTLLSIFAPYICYIQISDEIIRFFSVCITSVVSIFSIIYLIGINNKERLFFKNKLTLLLTKLRSKYK